MSSMYIVYAFMCLNRLAYPLWCEHLCQLLPAGPGRAPAHGGWDDAVSGAPVFRLVSDCSLPLVWPASVLRDPAAGSGRDSSEPGALRQLHHHPAAVGGSTQHSNVSQRDCFKLKPNAPTGGIHSAAQHFFLENVSQWIKSDLLFVIHYYTFIYWSEFEVMSVLWSYFFFFFMYISL